MTIPNTATTTLPLTLTRREALHLIGLGLLAPGILAGCSDHNAPVYRSTNYEATIADARAEIARLVATDGGPTTVSLALVDDQHIIWAEAFGSIDKSRNLAPTTETLLGLASGSKVIATVAAMILVDRGLVSLDAPFVNYLPDFRMAQGEAYEQITVRMLLNHSSGLPGCDYHNGVTLVPVPDVAAQVREKIATQRLKHAPGEMAVYCNDGFTLIELLVTAVTGQSYDEFVTQELFLPLGMQQSRFPKTSFAPGSFAPMLDMPGRPLPQEFGNSHASGGLYTTPSDMGRLAMMLLNGGLFQKRRILSAWAVAEMGTDQTTSLPFNPITDHPYHFGLGWDGVRQGGLAPLGVTAWYKGGDTNYHTEFIVAPGERLAVMVMDVSGGVADLLAERILIHALAERGSIAGIPKALDIKPGPAIPLTDQEQVTYAGVYAHHSLVMKLAPQADRTLTLFQFIGGQWKPWIEGLQLRDRKNGLLVADSLPELAFRVVAMKNNSYLVVRQYAGLKHYTSEQPFGQTLPSGQPLSDQWQTRITKRWLLVNGAYERSIAVDGITPLFSLRQIPESAGYLLVSAPVAGTTGQVVDPRGSDTRARMCLKIPVNKGRDLNDLEIETREGEEWVRWGSILYRPLETIATLTAGPQTITIGPEGLGEWRKLPAASTLTITGAGIWYLYDHDTDGNAFVLCACVMKDTTVKPLTATVPDGAYLLVHSAPNTEITVTL